MFENIVYIVFSNIMSPIPLRSEAINCPCTILLIRSAILAPPLNEIRCKMLKRTMYILVKCNLSGNSKSTKSSICSQQNQALHIFKILLIFGRKLSLCLLFMLTTKTMYFPIVLLFDRMIFQMCRRHVAEDALCNAYTYRNCFRVKMRCAMHITTW